jgi:hypothetical protein
VIPLKLSELEFEDAMEVALRMLADSLVPVPRVVAGVAALARASEREGGAVEFAKSHVNDRAFRRAGPRLRFAVFIAGMEGRALRAEDVPGTVDDSATLSAVDALRRDDPPLLEESLGTTGGLSTRTLFELGFDVVSLAVPRAYSLDTAIGALAVESKARRCAHAYADSAYLCALVKGLRDMADELADGSEHPEAVGRTGRSRERRALRRTRGR